MPIITRTFALSLLLGAVAAPCVVAADAPAVVVVHAGAFARKDTPVSVSLSPRLLGPDAWNSPLKDWPRSVTVQDLNGGPPIVGQVDATMAALNGGLTTILGFQLTFVLPGETPAKAERRFRLDPRTLAARDSPWSLSDPSSGALDLKNRGRPVFRYNMTPVANKDFPKVPARDAYIHPAFTPSGALITGDFSKAHPHHRGFFLAYTKTQVGDLHPDFWNIHNGTGSIVFDRLDSSRVGPVTAQFSSRHRWEAKGAGAVLRESWQIQAYDVPGSPYWLFDLTSTQQALGKPIELPPYRYGGMAYRGPEPFLKGPLDVLTSAGLDRKKGDQKPARWVDLTGPVAEGSDRYGGAMILDHPSNPHHPTPARIHPTTLPFFAFTPSHDTALTIPADKPTFFRYRIVLHDGHPDAALDERLWHDFAEPPVVTVERNAD